MLAGVKGRNTSIWSLQGILCDRVVAGSNGGYLSPFLTMQHETITLT